MATRLYTNRDYYMDWLTAILTLKGGWDAPGSLGPQPLYFSPTKENTSASYRTYQATTTAPGRRAMLYGITPRLTAQTISGTVNPLLYFGETDLGLNAFPRMHIYVTVGDTDAVRGILLNQFEDTVNEFALANFGNPTAQRFGAPQTLTPVAAQDGDRIGIEVGWVQNAALGTQYVQCVSGTRYQNGDAIVGTVFPNNSTNLNQYIDFSADLVFKPGLPNDHCSGATLASTFPYSNTVNTFNSAPVNTPNPEASCSPWGDDSLPVWWLLRAPAGSTLTIHTQGSAYPTIATLWSGSCGALSEVACAEGPTAAAPLTYGPTSGADYYLLVQRDVYADGENVITGPGGLVSVSVSTGTAAPSGCLDAITISAIPTTISGLDTTGLPTDTLPVLSYFCCTAQKHMQWFQYTPTVPHRLYLSTAGTTYAHALAVYTGSCPYGPWTEVVCHAGRPSNTPPMPAQISLPVTAGTTYWVIVAADDYDLDNPNPGGTLQLFFGDTNALGFIHAGERGAVEWEGQYAYHNCNGNPCFLQILSNPYGDMLIALRLYQVGSCGDGVTEQIDVSQLYVLARVSGGGGGVVNLPLIPDTAFPVPPGPCQSSGFTVLYGHRDFAQPPQPYWATNYYGVFKFRFRLSSWDTISNALMPDGYVEVTWPGSSFGTYRWDNLTLGGHAWEGFQFSPGWWTDRVYLRKIDEYCGWDPTASDLVWYRDFVETPGTEAELFSEFGGLFDRVQHWECQQLYPAPPLPGSPRLDEAGRPTYQFYVGTPPQLTTSCFDALRRVPAFPPPEPPPGPSTGCPAGDFPIDPDRPLPPVLIPAGTILVSGIGYRDVFGFISPDGTTSYPQPPSHPIPGAGVQVLCRTSEGHIGKPASADPFGAGLWRGSDLTILSEFTDPDGIVLPGGNGSIATDGLGNWYLAGTSGDSYDFAFVRFVRISSASAITRTWDIPVPRDPYGYSPGVVALAVSADGQTAYCWMAKAPPDPETGNSRIHKFDLSGAGGADAWLGPLGTDYCERTPGFQSLFVLPGSGDVIAAFADLNGALGFYRPGAIRRYTPTGTVVWTAGMPAGGVLGKVEWMYLAPGLPGDTHFLAWAHDQTLESDDDGPSITYSECRYCWFDYATGTPDNTRNYTPDGKNYDDAHFAGDGDSIYFRFDSALAVLKEPILGSSSRAAGRAPLTNVALTLAGGSHTLIAIDLTTGAVHVVYAFGSSGASSFLYRPEHDDFLVSSGGGGGTLLRLDRSFALLQTVVLPDPPPPAIILWELQAVRSDYQGGLYVHYATSPAEVDAGDQFIRQLDPVTFAVLHEWRGFLPRDSRSYVPADSSLDGTHFLFAMRGGPDLYQNVIYSLNLASGVAAPFTTYGSYSGGVNPTGDSYFALFLRPRGAGYVAATFHQTTGAVDTNALLLIAADGTISASYPVNPTASSAVTGLAVSADGQTAWYVTTAGRLARVDLTTGTDTLITAAGLGSSVGDLVVFEGGGPPPEPGPIVFACVKPLPIDPDDTTPVPPPPRIPAGTIMIGGWGNSPAGPGCQFLSPDGRTSYPPPPGWATTQTDITAFCRLPAGHVGVSGANAPQFAETGSGLLKASDLSVLSENTTDRSAGFCIAADALGNWYNFRVGFDTGFFTRFDAASTIVASWDIPLGGASGYQQSATWAMAVSPDGQTAYVWLQTNPFASSNPDRYNFRIIKFDLSGAGVLVGPISSDYSYHPGTGSLLTILDGSGDVLAAFHDVNHGPGAVRRYTPSGTLVWTSGLPAGADPTLLSYESLALGVPGDTHFLAYLYDNIATSSSARYCWFSYAAGAPDNSRNFTPDDGTGFYFDSQFVVLSVGIP